MEIKKSFIANIAALAASLGIAFIAPDAGLAMIMGGLGTNLGSQFIYDTLNPAWQRMFKGEDGILNHDIQKALVAAIQEAYKHIEKKYIEIHKPNEYQKEAIKKFLADLSSEATQHLLSETAATDPVKAEELLQYLSFNNTQETYPQLAERLKLLTPIPNEWGNDGLSETFLDFFKEHLAPLVKEAFFIELNNNSIAKTKIEFLYSECLLQSVTEGNTQILEAINELKTRNTRTDVYAELWVGAIRRFHNKLDDLKQGQDAILSEVHNLPDKIQQAVANELQKLTPSAIIPKRFDADEQYNLLKKQLQQLQTEFDNLTKEINETREEISSSPEGRIKELAQKWLQELTNKQLQCSREINETQKDLEIFLIGVLNVAASLGKIDVTQNLSLQQARQLFEEGKFMEANAALDETEMDKEGEAINARSETLANKYLLKAQLTALNKTLPNWFEEAKRFYEEAIKTYQSYNTCFACAYFLQTHNQHNQAIKYYQQALGFAKDETEKATMLNNLGLLHSDKNEFPQAEEAYREALNIRRALAEVNPQTYLPAVATTLNNLGALHRAKNEIPQAEAAYTEALNIRRSLAEVNPQIYLPDVAMTLNNLGILHSDKNEFPQAEEAYSEALNIYRSLAEVNPQIYLPDVAMTLNNLGILHSDKNEFPQAEEAYSEALNIYRSLAKVNPQIYLPDVAMTLNNLAVLHSDKNEFPQAEEAYREALNIRRSLAEINPQTYLPDVAMTLNNLGILHSDKNEFPQAEEAYREALNIRRALAEVNPQTYLPKVAMTLNNLAVLHSDKNEFPQAEEAYSEALNIYRSLAEVNPQIYLPDVAMTLNNLGILHSDKNEFPQAEEAYREALNIRRALAEVNPQTYLPNVAMTLNNLGILHRVKNEFPQAEEAYREALNSYRALAEVNPQTYLPDVAMTATNISIFYLQSVPNKDQSLAFAKDALKAALPFVEILPVAQQIASTILQIVQDWGLDPETFKAECIKELEEDGR